VFGPQRHDNLADALPVPRGGAVVDLGCGKGETLAALATRLDSTSRLVGLDAKQAELAVEGAELVVADLERQAQAGEFFYSLNDYAVLLRKPGRKLG
jgi:cyclopropane fatty-acyl-phospholipid synthase-like methyltransferase